ncbi:MAG: acetylglutamate kinase [Chloroflexi bacterium]|nr:acetylglutamate kinase [Chloroflexota bacterium]
MPYVTYFIGRVVVVKYGGSTMGSSDTTVEDVLTLHRLGIKPVLVHGGGASITEWLGRLGQEARFVHGLRVTDEATLEVVAMVLAGSANKELVSQLAALGGRAIGLSGVDAGLIQARIKDPDLGLVGEVARVETSLIDQLLQSGYIPVIAPLGVAADGQILNINADTAAAEIAVALGAEKLIFLTDVGGIVDADGQLIPQLSRQEVEELISGGVISGGMIPKVQACLRALDGVRRTHIIDGRVPHALIRELFTDRGVGSMITTPGSEAERLPGKR